MFTNFKFLQFLILFHFYHFFISFLYWVFSFFLLKKRIFLWNIKLDYWPFLINFPIFYFNVSNLIIIILNYLNPLLHCILLSFLHTLLSLLLILNYVYHIPSIFLLSLHSIPFLLTNSLTKITHNWSNCFQFHCNSLQKITHNPLLLIHLLWHQPLDHLLQHLYKIKSKIYCNVFLLCNLYYLLIILVLHLISIILLLLISSIKYLLILKHIKSILHFIKSILYFILLLYLLLTYLIDLIYVVILLLILKHKFTFL